MSVNQTNERFDVPRFSPMIMKAAKIPAMIPDTNGPWVSIDHAKDLWNAVQIYKTNVAEVAASLNKVLKELPELRAENGRLQALLEAEIDARERAVADLRAMEAS